MALFLWLLLCAFISYCADRKGQNKWIWGLAALFLSPLIAGIILVLIPDEDGNGSEHSSQSLGEAWNDDSHDERRCSECGYIADGDEQFCPRCGEMLW